MPIYEHACGRCGKLSEELVFSTADEAGAACPACGPVEVKRCLSACAAVVSGAPSGAGAVKPLKQRHLLRCCEKFKPSRMRNTRRS